MIRFTRTAVTAQGQSAQAMEFAAKVTQLVNERYPDAGVRWGMEVGGTAGTIHWFMDLPDLLTVEQMFTGLLSDPEYLSLVDSSGAAFLPGAKDSMVAML